MRSRFPAAAALILASLAGSAVAQDDAAFLQRANDLYRGPDRAVPDARRSDLVLVPLLTAMTPPPAGVDTPLRAALATPNSPAWSAAAEWAGAATQRELLDAIRRVGEPLGSTRNFAFLMPYGEGEASPKAREAGVVVRVGEPPVLAAAEFAYLDALDRAACLVNVEATRLAAENKAQDGATLLVRWIHFSRQIADREFTAEKQWAVRSIITTLERLRDLVHEHPDQFTGAAIADIVSSISEDHLGVERLQVPRGNLVAGQQILARAFVERQGPSDAFGATMARASAGDRPLRLFTEASRWQDAAAKHGNTFETGDALTAVFRDWEYRWRLPEHDRGRKQSTDFDRLSAEKFSTVHLVAGGVQDLFGLRQRLRAEAEATRIALGVMGYQRDNGVFPRSLAAIRPRYVRTVGADPYSESGQEFHFFVPVRDQPRGERDLPKPHEVSVALPEGISAGRVDSASSEEAAPEAPTAPVPARPGSARGRVADPASQAAANSFTVGLRDDTFILYSAGTDQQRQWATRVGEGAPDTLYWPPILSLTRDRLTEAGVDPAIVAAPLLWITPSSRGAESSR